MITDDLTIGCTAVDGVALVGAGAVAMTVFDTETAEEWDVEDVTDVV
jgi:hypothetical protein